ncbi:MAG: mandelate racemase/muconate lactonizing enzyme family protein [Candidatus Latescibacteria bacterium]|nr:mandelate racemase/muconate lactonizing enzyme family protein [Candidatus Latescibacterota bacterium]
MKITAIKPWIIQVPWSRQPGQGPSPDYKRELVFAQVDTDEGLTGWGEVTTYPGEAGNRSVAHMIREVGATLIGRDPAHIERIWHDTVRSLTYVGTRGAVSATASAIDIALWDIRGKALGLPIYMLLGGPVRDSIALYTHPPGIKDLDRAVEDAQEIVAAGYKAMKFDPMIHAIPEGNAHYIDGQISRAGMEAAWAITAAIRQAVGPSIELLIDAHGKYNVPTAIDLCRGLEESDIFWFEEPVPVESNHALRQVRERVKAKISVGERLFTRWEFIEVFEKELADFIMPDVTWTGGISELKKIATLAESYYVPISPHDASGPINVMAGAQVMMTVPNFYKLETSRYDLSDYNQFIDQPLDIRQGDLYLPERPGLGVELVPEALVEFAVEGFD